MSDAPTIGRIVHYRLTSSDAALIGQQNPPGPSHLNPPLVGDYYPAMVVRVFGNGEQRQPSGVP